MIFCELQIISHKKKICQRLKAKLSFLYKEEPTAYQHTGFLSIISEDTIQQMLPGTSYCFNVPYFNRHVCTIQTYIMKAEC